MEGLSHVCFVMDTARLVVALVDGRAQKSGTRAELMAHHGLYARLVRSQSLLS